MSRSYKKPIRKGGDRSKKVEKRFANKNVRNASDIQNGCAYKRLFDRYDLWDYREAYWHKSDLRRYDDELINGYWCDYFQRMEKYPISKMNKKSYLYRLVRK